MIPETPPGPGPGQVAEAALWHALRQGLDDGFFVYTHCGYDAGGPGGEGEVDFLVVHRELGMLAIECKGRGVEFRDGQWKREEDGEWKPMPKSPFQQADRNAKELVKELHKRAAAVIPNLPRIPFAYGHAVAFPRHDWAGGALPPDARVQTLLDSRDLARLGEKVPAALALARSKAGKVEPLDPPSFRKFRKHVIAPRFRLVETIGARIRSAEPQQVRLSELQRRAARGWIDNPRMRIAGGAGTGKTLAAVEAARLMAQAGRSVLLLCYNKALADHLKGCVGDEGCGPGTVEATSFHRLCAAAYHACGRRMDVPGDERDRARFWLEDAPYVLLEAVAEGRIDRRDAIVIDEGQDFAASWWEVVEALLGDAGTGRVLVFHDPAQDIFGRGSPVPAWPGITLDGNFRNARRINEVVCRLGGVRMESTWDAAEGEEPRVWQQGTRADTLCRVEGLIGDLLAVQRLLPDQIAILTPHTRRNSALADREEIAGVALADDPSDRDGRVLHTTIGAFKGLESDVVILLDIDPADPLSNLRARYVAASRARHALYVFARGNWEG